MPTTRAFVLVLDDLPDAADSLGDLLTLWGYDAAACYCGASALTVALARPPAAVVLDLGMAPIDGFEFAVRFRRLPGCGSTPLVALSGHAGQAYHDRAREAGIGHYLLKPAEPAAVQTLLARLIRHGKPSDFPCRLSIPGDGPPRELGPASIPPAGTGRRRTELRQRVRSGPRLLPARGEKS